MKVSPKRKVCFVITSKIHYTRNKLVLEALRAHPQIMLQIVVGGAALLEKYGLVESEMIADGFSIDAHCYMILDGGVPVTMAKSTGVGLMEIASVFERLTPDIVLIRGDRFEVLSAAIAAAYMNIPVAHIEGGDVTGSIDESVRHAITKLAHIHFPTNDESGARIVRMGERPDSVHVVGSPELEVVIKTDVPPSAELVNYLGVGTTLDFEGKFLMVMQHPVTTEIESARAQILETLRAVSDLKIPTLWFWPNADAGSDALSKGIRSFREKHDPQHVRFLKYVPADQFYALLRRTACLVGNSSAGFKEAALLGTPVVNIGTRQGDRYGVQAGSHLVHAGYDSTDIAGAISLQVEHGRFESNTFLYREDTASRIAAILAMTELYSQKIFVD